MQIGYPALWGQRGPGALAWDSPNVDNSLRAMDGPAVYAPYGTPGWWPVHSTPPGVSYMTSNPASANSPIAAAIRASMGDVPPASSPAQAAATGLPLGPISLVAPMPSMTGPSADQVSTTTIPTPPPPAPGLCDWVAANPGLATLAAIGAYLLMAGGKK